MEKGAMRKRSEMTTTPLTESQSRQLASLVKAVKFNHGIGSGKYIIRVNPSEEIRKYKERIAQLTLPNRFGMYKGLTNRAKYDPNIVLEEPKTQLDSTSYEKPDQDHKVRPIFPLDD